MMIDTKEKTALVPSVGAEEGQSFQTISENIIPTSESEINDQIENSGESFEEMCRRLQRLSDPHYLHTVSMTELYQTTFDSRPSIIDGLLDAGAYLLVGSPKIGKSFLVAQIAYHVSTGQKLWDFEVHKGTVLYLALEDDYQRIQKRMFMMYGVDDSPTLRFATAASKLGYGLDEQIEGFIRDYPDAKLIIVDTLQKVREVVGEAYSYAADYEIISRLKQLADKHRVCILAVHHTRKQAASDKFDSVSGTNGIAGSADGTLVMEKPVRTGLEATIHVTGRDHQDQILYLKKDPVTQIWNLDRLENELHIEPPDPVLEAVAKLVSVEQFEWTGSPSELAEVIHSDMAVNSLSKYLNIRCGKLLEDYNIQYENKAKHSGRRIILTYTPPKAVQQSKVRRLRRSQRLNRCYLNNRRNRRYRCGKEKNRMKSVQIPYDLFVDLVLYHLNGEDDFDEEIRQGLEQKLDAMLNRQLYSRYKTAPTEEQREQARQEYLDRRGVSESYRWSTSPWER